MLIQNANLKHLVVMLEALGKLKVDKISLPNA